MPINKDIPVKKQVLETHWNEVPKTTFKNALENIVVELVQAPTRQEVLAYLPSYSLATWEAKPRNDYTATESINTLKDLFKFKLLPSAMETIRFTFLISGIDLIDVTHLIRHRNMSFSAHCTGDRDLRHDVCTVKPSIMTSQKIYSEYKYIVKRAKNLYAEMLDTKMISIADARTILPRALENHYYASVNLKDFIGFFNQRKDVQIQPESDNLLAMKMLVHIATIFPEIKYAVDPESVDRYFVNTCQEDHSSSLYYPEKKNDVFEWNPDNFLYGRKRKDMWGGEDFVSRYKLLLVQYKNLVSAVKD